MSATTEMQDEFSLSSLKNYTREFKSTPVEVCSTSSTKTYEDYRCITVTGSAQYQYIHEHCTIDEETGLLIDEDGFIGVAMGYTFGEIGTRYYVELDTGITIPVVKVDAKAAIHATNGCSANADASVIEFVIDEDKAFEYFGGVNGYACNGNLNNNEYLNGNISKISLVSDEKVETGVVYVDASKLTSVSEESDNVKFVEGGF